MNIVFDLDGTLADTTHRLEKLGDDPSDKEWEEYHHACMGDPTFEHVVNVFRCLRGRYISRNVIEIWTGRGEGAGRRVRNLTLHWLRTHICLGFVDYETAKYFKPPGGRIDDIVVRMRPHKDNRPDFKIKREWLEESIEQGNPPDLVFEDRDQVVRMWREHDIPCFQVKDGRY